MSSYSPSELLELGLGRVGKNVTISRKASFHNPAGISIGDHVRIDDFCVISAGQEGIEIGSFVHIAAFCSVVGAKRISFGDFSGLSARVSVFSSSDDYGGRFLTNPTVPPEFTNVQHGEVSIGRHVIVGAGSVLLPRTRLGEGVAVGALSLVHGRCAEFGIYSGVPARRIKERHRDLLALEVQLLAALSVDATDG